MAALLGAVMGSFLNCAAWRMARGERFVSGRSRCPACGHTLGAAELAPVFGWLFLRGRCRWCGARISPRYVLTELLFAFLTATCLLRFDLTVLCARNWILFCCLFCLSLVDFDCFEIPDGCLIAAAAAWVLALPPAWPGWRTVGTHLLAALVYGGGMLAMSLAMDRILKKESLGGGDVKLFALMGLYLGLAASLFAMLFSCVLALCLSLPLRRRTPPGDGTDDGEAAGKRIPFGPAIAAATWGMLLFGQPLADWYLGLL